MMGLLNTFLCLCHCCCHQKGLSKKTLNMVNSRAVDSPWTKVFPQFQMQSGKIWGLKDFQLKRMIL